MDQQQLITDWVCIAREGTTIDGRNLERPWLIDMADTYDYKTYAALIWPEHTRWFGNYGETLELKAEEGIEDKLMRLYARLQPNQYLRNANSEQQLLFCSVEIDLDFANSGKAYLTGLAVTDSPASLGTDRLRFKTKNNSVICGAPEKFIIGELKNKTNNHFNQLPGEKTPPENINPEGTMDEELQKIIDDLIARVAALEAKESVSDQVIEDAQAAVEEATTAIAEATTAVEEIKTEVETVVADVEEIKTEVASDEYKSMKAGYVFMSKQQTQLPNPAPNASNKLTLV